jgi:flagellar protein FlaG
MTNDIGMIKAVTRLAQTNPSASTGAGGADAPAKTDSGHVRQTEQARKEKAAEPLENVVSDLNKLVHELHRELRFAVDDESGDTVIKVIDRETDEVVRQIPSEEVMRLRKRLQEAAGVIFHDSA